MDLREELIFKSSKGPKLELQIPEEEGVDDKLTLGLKGAFNKSLAATLGVDWLFASDTVAQPGLKDGNLKSDIAFNDIELKLVPESGDPSSFYIERVHAFRVFASGGGSLGIQCKIDMTGHLDEVLDFFRAHRSSGFEFRLKARQNGLFGDGTRVDMSTPLPDPDEDRSHENRPRGGRRGKKVQSIAETVIAEIEAENPSEQADLIEEQEEVLIN
jgi:hypothetical protein